MPQILRINPERRSGKERRRIFSLHRFFHKGPERRKALHDRRLLEERRDGWVRISKWSSVNLHDLKISKFLHQKEHRTVNDSICPKSVILHTSPNRQSVRGFLLPNWHNGIMLGHISQCINLRRCSSLFSITESVFHIIFRFFFILFPFRLYIRNVQIGYVYNLKKFKSQ